MIDIIHCDDNKEYILYMEKLINKAMPKDEELSLKTYNSGEELVEGLKEEAECDILILDMQMPGMDGDETAKLFRERFAEALLIFCSGEVEPSTESFEVEPFGYLKKEMADERILVTLKRALDRIVEKKKQIYVTIDNKDIKSTLKVSNIIYVETVGRDCDIHYNVNGLMDTICVHKNMSEMKEILKEYRFASPHKSYFVNMEHVTQMGTTELKLSDGTIIPISKHKKKEFSKIYMKK